MSISVRTIETGEVPSKCWSPPESVLKRYRDAYGSSLRQWVEEVRGESCQCCAYNCDGVEHIGHGYSVILVNIRFPKTLSEKLRAMYQDFRGIDRNIHGVSDETAATALHDKYGNRASALFTCNECYHQHGHHREGEWWEIGGDIGETPVYERAVGKFPVQSLV